ncbi:50S ribosomal protein L11 methyltransferase [Candidatus Bathyarchaeota archaeon]|nr:50S ribosomal protein L11 methyltransferase [Candidatus Bathyarchaeota archaeon]
MKRKHLAILLSRLEPNPEPKLKWESYNIDAESAAEMVYTAFLHGDIKGKRIADLGCGSGILGIAAMLLGASQAVGVEIDKTALETAVINAKKAGVKIDLILGDIECIVGRFDTVLMNPPFGTWRKGFDVKFLRKAIEISDVIYSLHKRSESVRLFLRREISRIGGKVDWLKEMTITIGRIYPFHKKTRYQIEVDLYRILTRKRRS